MEYKSIGIKISELRKQKSITQEELAKALKISSQAVSKWENGGEPDISLIPSIAEFFGVTIDSLFQSITVSENNLFKMVEDYLSKIDDPYIHFKKAKDLCLSLISSYFMHPEAKEGLVDPLAIEHYEAYL